MATRFDPHKHHRRSIRLKGFDDSSPGAYFVTMVTQGREGLFGEIVHGEMRLNQYAGIVLRCWNEIPNHFPNVDLGAFVIMPNHVHGIIFINEDRRGEVLSPNNEISSPRNHPGIDIQNEYIENARNPDGITTKPGGITPPRWKPTLGQIIAWFKYQSTKEMNIIETKNAITRFWQRNYYEHVIRDEKELNQTTDYILANPSRRGEADENRVLSK